MLSHEVLAVIWFAILAIAWIVYLSMESFIVGSGMLQTAVAKETRPRMNIMFSSGLHWDGIEVWLIVAIGGTFAAFPAAYAKLLESLYLAIFLLIFAIIIRGVTMELAYKDESPVWQKYMTLGWKVSSFLIPLVLGVYIANVFLGLALGKEGYEGSFFSLFSMPALIMGLLFVAIAITTGSYWIILTTKQGEHHEKAHRIAFRSSIVVVLATLFELMALNTGSTVFEQSQLYTSNVVFWAIPVVTVLVSLLAVLFAYKKKVWLAFLSSLLVPALLVTTGYTAIFPYIVPSSIDPQYGITLYDAASSQYTLTVMFYSALVFVPLVLCYQAWKFWYFAKDRRKKAA